ncbi:MAG: hypothetical protein JW717_11975 [Marinilabiliaceae bacterium]|nr:hypothetical protein [Marinilabiliaceae bacterium]
MMTDEELHYLGIKVVYKDLIDKGYDVLNIRKEMDVNPQILAKKDGRFVFITVKTARYPYMGVLYPHVASDVLHVARKRNAVCYFASVGIANANGQTEEEMAKPIADGEYYINYKGLQSFPR